MHCEQKEPISPCSAHKAVALSSAFPHIARYGRMNKVQKTIGTTRHPHYGIIYFNLFFLSIKLNAEALIYGDLD